MNLVFSRDGLHKTPQGHIGQSMAAQHLGAIMPPRKNGWSPKTHRLMAGVNWRIGKTRDAMVALRGRHGQRVEEIRLIDRTKSRHLDWASNIVIVKLRGIFCTELESQCVYRLCRAWWQRRTQLNEVGIGGFFTISTREDGRYEISLKIRGSENQHINDLLGGSLTLRPDPEAWETLGLRLLDISADLLKGAPIEALEAEMLKIRTQTLIASA